MIMAEQAAKMHVANQLNKNLALLQCGATVTIDISTPAGQKGKFRTIFIGYLPKKYVLVQFPDSNKLGNFAQYVTQGTGVTVRGLIEGHEGAVVAFISTIKQTLQIPSRILVLEFPQNVGLQNLRSSVRIDTQIQAKVKINNEYWKATIANMSINGCQLDIVNGEKLVLAEDKSIEIVVEDFQASGNVKLSATICNLKQQVEGVFFGVKFDEDSKQQVSELLHFSLISET